MQTSKWLIATLRPSQTEQTVKQLRRAGVEVVNFRREERVPIRLAHRQVRWDMGERPMFPGYIFVRTERPERLADMPFGPRLIKSEDTYRSLSAARLAHLQFLIGDTELLRVRAMQYIEGDVVRYRDFTYIVQFVKNLADGQILRIEPKAFESSRLVGVAAQEVRSEAVELLSN